MAGRNRWSVVAFTTMLVLGGCAGGSGGSEGVGGTASTSTPEPVAMPVSVVPDAMRQAGSPLVDGLEVQPGSSLVGSAVPLADQYPAEDAEPGVPVAPRGWQAVFAVHGDPVAVWDAYASALGIADRADAIHACTVEQFPPLDYEYTQPPARFLTEPAMDREDRLVCRAQLRGVGMDLIVGSSPCPEAETVDDCPMPTAHLYAWVVDEPTEGELAWEQLGTDELRDVRTVDARVEADDQTIEPIEIPEGPVIPPRVGLPGLEFSDLPAAGERIDDGMDHFLGTEDFLAGPALLPDGARSLVAPAMLVDCNGGLIAVVEVPGAPKEVVGSFDPEAFQRASDFRLSGTADGVDWASFMYDSAGGYYLHVTAVDAGGGRSIVLARECGD